MVTKKSNGIQPLVSLTKASKVKTVMLGLYFLGMAVVLMFFILQLWPSESSGASETTLIIIVMLAGALGSYVHAATSFVTYIGNRSLTPSWIWWYVLRPFIGMALALIFYFVVRGGLLSVGAGADGVNYFGIAAVAALVGMFSKQATDKLQELFDNLFKTEKGKGDDQRKDKLEEGMPVLDVMIAAEKIKACTIPKGNAEKDVKIGELHNLLKGIVTRIPVLDDEGVVKYVIHQSLLYKFIAESSIAVVQKGAAFNVQTATLDDLLAYPGMREVVADSLAFISHKSTLADARVIMEQTNNCQDVFVTETGGRHEPIKGWLTNIEIAKNLQA